MKKAIFLISLMLVMLLAVTSCNNTAPNDNGKPNDGTSGDSSQTKHAHIQAEPVKENEKAATCTEAGSYEEVIYCSDKDCNAEISRTEKILNPTGHDEAPAYEDCQIIVLNNQKYYAYFCTKCHHWINIDVVSE